MGIGPKTTLALTDKKSAAKAQNQRSVPQSVVHVVHSFKSVVQALQTSKSARNWP